MFSMCVFTVGCFAHVSSYTTANASPTIPRTNGQSTRADDQGYLIPPHVRPMMHEQVEEIRRKLPLRSCQHQTSTHAWEMYAHSQSSFSIFSRRLSRGALSCRQKNTTTSAIAQSGRFISDAYLFSVAFGVMERDLQNIQRHDAC